MGMAADGRTAATPLVGNPAAKLGLGKPKTLRGTQRNAGIAPPIVVIRCVCRCTSLSVRCAGHARRSGATGRGAQGKPPSDTPSAAAKGALSLTRASQVALTCSSTSSPPASQRPDGRTAGSARLDSSAPPQPPSSNAVHCRHSQNWLCAATAAVPPCVPVRLRGRGRGRGHRRRSSTSRLAPCGAMPIEELLIHDAGTGPLKQRRLCRRFSWPSWMRRTASQNRQPRHVAALQKRNLVAKSSQAPSTPKLTGRLVLPSATLAALAPRVSAVRPFLPAPARHDGSGAGEARAPRERFKPRTSGAALGLASMACDSPMLCVLHSAHPSAGLRPAQGSA